MHKQLPKSFMQKIGLTTPELEIAGQVRRVAYVFAYESSNSFLLFLHGREQPYKIETMGRSEAEQIAMLEPGDNVRMIIKAPSKEVEDGSLYHRVLSVERGTAVSKDESLLVTQ